jgi:hypothetical protein
MRRDLVFRHGSDNYVGHGSSAVRIVFKALPGCVVAFEAYPCDPLLLPHTDEPEALARSQRNFGAPGRFQFARSNVGV